jgi:hypothetical protein
MSKWCFETFVQLMGNNYKMQQDVTAVRLIIVVACFM